MPHRLTARDVCEAHQQAEAEQWPHFPAKSWEKLLEADKAMYERMAQLLNEKLAAPQPKEPDIFEKLFAPLLELTGDEPLMCCHCGTRAANRQCPGCKAYFCDVCFQVHLRDNAKYLEERGDS